MKAEGQRQKVEACECRRSRAPWRDLRAKGGMIRTECAKCGRFIGFRPAEAQRK